VACDLVGCRCPRLQGCPTKHDCAQTGKALPAVPLGTAARIGSVGTQRLAIPCLRVCLEAAEAEEAALQRRLLQQVQTLLAPDEALVTGRGFPLAQQLRTKQSPTAHLPKGVRRQMREGCRNASRSYVSCWVIPRFHGKSQSQGIGRSRQSLSIMYPENWTGD